MVDLETWSVVPKMHREILKGLMAGAVLVQDFARVCLLEWGLVLCGVTSVFLIEFLTSELNVERRTWGQHQIRIWLILLQNATKSSWQK